MPDLNEQKIQKLDLPWKWSIPGSYHDQRPVTKYTPRRKGDVDGLFANKADKYVPTMVGNIACFKIDPPNSFYQIFYGISMGNLNDTQIHIDDVLTGTVFDGETFS